MVELLAQPPASPPSFYVGQLLELESQLNGAVLGQPQAARIIAEKLGASVVGTRSPQKPRGVFVFTGRTGTGKTLTAEVLSKLFYPRCEAPVKETDIDWRPHFHAVNMAEFSHDHEIAKFLGAPPGYTGHSDQAALAFLNKRPRTVLLLDEVEKAHPNIWKYFLSPFDKGFSRDGANNAIDFKDAVICMSSNHPDIKKLFPPEFLNRIDAIIDYKPLTKEHYEVILDRKFREMSANIKSASNRDIDLILAPEARERFASQLERQEMRSAQVKRAGKIGFGPAMARLAQEKSAVASDGILPVDPGEGARAAHRLVESVSAPLTMYLLKNYGDTSARTIEVTDLLPFSAVIKTRGNVVIDTIGQAVREASYSL